MTSDVSAQALQCPAYRIETERMVLRCWQPTDAPALLHAISLSLDHLREWMPWAASEPSTLEEKIALLRKWRAAFDQDEDYVFGIFSPDEKEVWGGSGLHRRLSGNALEIGYWIRVDRTNIGLATESSAALTKVAFAVNRVDRVEIHCHPANARSASIPRKLGFTQQAVSLPQDEGPDNEPVETLVWTIFRDQLETTPLAKAAIRAYDVAGREIALG